MLTLRFTIPSRVTMRFTSSSGSGVAGAVTTGVGEGRTGFSVGVPIGGGAAVTGTLLGPAGSAPTVGGLALTRGVSVAAGVCVPGGAAVTGVPVGGAAVTGVPVGGAA